MSTHADILTEGQPMVRYEGSRIRSFRSPESLDDQLEEFCERTGSEASEVIRTALVQYLARHKPDKKAENARSRAKK